MNLSDRRSYVLHQAVAEKIRSNPDLLVAALQALDRYEARVGHHRPYRRWREIIQRGVGDVVRVLLDTSEESQVLRSASPFAGFLSDQERRSILDTISRR